MQRLACGGYMQLIDSEAGSQDGHCDWPIIVNTANVGAGCDGSTRSDHSDKAENWG